MLVDSGLVSFISIPGTGMNLAESFRPIYSLLSISIKSSFCVVYLNFVFFNICEQNFCSLYFNNWSARGWICPIPIRNSHDKLWNHVLSRLVADLAIIDLINLTMSLKAKIRSIVVHISTVTDTISVLEIVDMVVSNWLQSSTSFRIRMIVFVNPTFLVLNDILLSKYSK